MAKKTNDETIDLLYLNNNTQNIKNKKKKKNKNKNVPKKVVTQNDIIDLDNEIIIGLTPPKIKKENNENTKKGKSKKQAKVQYQKQSNQKEKNVKKNRVRIKVLKCTSILVFLLGTTILFMISPVFNIKQINVEGVEKIPQEEVINLSQIQLDENIFKIKISDIIKKLETNTHIEKVDITRELPSTVKISVKERQPRYIIEVGNGNAYIDSYGCIIEISTEKLELPILLGYKTEINNIIDFENTKRLSDEDCQKIQILNNVIESAQNNNVLSYITSIDMEDITDIKLNLQTEKKIAYLGDCSDINLRILYLKKIIEEEDGKEGEIFVNGDLQTQKPKPYFREKV